MLSKRMIIGLVLSIIIMVIGFNFRKFNIRKDDISSVAGNELSGGEVQVAELEKGLARVYLSVSGMGCSSCAPIVEAALKNVNGVKSIVVDLFSNKAIVDFNPAVISDPEILAQRVSQSGYPTSVDKILNPSELAQAVAIAEEKAKEYFATVNEIDIPIAEFDREVQRAAAKYTKLYGANLFNTNRGKALLQKIKAQTAQQLINEGLMYQEVLKAKIEVSNAEVEAAIGGLQRKLGITNDQKFENWLSVKQLSQVELKAKLRKQLAINKYLNNYILADSANDFERQKAYYAWYQNLQQLSDVTIYDANVKAALAAAQGAGGCGS